MSLIHGIRSWSSRFRLSSASRPRSVALRLEQLEDRLVPSASGPSVALPSSAPGPLDGGPTGPYTPAQIRQAYRFNQISFNNGTVAGDGSGQTIAIIVAYKDANIGSDLHTFDTTYGLPDPVLTIAPQTIAGKPPAVDTTGRWELETALDVEWAHAIAPGANILLVEANTDSEANLFSAAQYAASQPGVSVVSMSFGLPEAPADPTFDSVFSTPAGHAGVTFVAASGDQGQLTYPASSPNVLAVGGTSLTLDSAGNYVSETAWSNSGGGLSVNEREPAYQMAVQSTGKRSTPDVAYNAAPGSGYRVYDSFNSQNPWQLVNGTSAGAPQWAALIAIADQGRALQGMGTLDGATQTLPMLYAMPSTAFHDITVGSNPGNVAGPGYDMVTGLGSPYADRVVASLAQEPVAPLPLGSQGNNPPPASPPPATPTAPPNPFDEVAQDALLVLRGLESNNLSMVLAGLQDFESVLQQARAPLQQQLQQAFLLDFLMDLLGSTAR
jgi:subtilase family serine protease